MVHSHEGDVHDRRLRYRVVLSSFSAVIDVSIVDRYIVDRQQQYCQQNKPLSLPQTNPALKTGPGTIRSEIAAPETLVASQNALVNSFNLLFAAVTRKGHGHSSCPPTTAEYIHTLAPNSPRDQRPANCQPVVLVYFGQQHATAVHVSTVSKYRNPNKPKFAACSSGLAWFGQTIRYNLNIVSGITGLARIHVTACHIMSQHPLPTPALVPPRTATARLPATQTLKGRTDLPVFNRHTSSRSCETKGTRQAGERKVSGPRGRAKGTVAASSQKTVHERVYLCETVSVWRSCEPTILFLPFSFLCLSIFSVYLVCQLPTYISLREKVKSQESRVKSQDPKSQDD
jgi:hypothetical protein